MQQTADSSQDVLFDNGINLTEPLQLGLVGKDGENGNSWIGADESGHDVCLPPDI